VNTTGEWIEVEGLRIHCLMAGQAGSPVLLLHGGGYETEYPMEFTTVISGRLVHTGEDGTQTDDTLVHVTSHVTQNANGELTAVAENVVFHCD
jgi:hypothetical protein